MSTLLETLASYVPSAVARRFEADPTPITQPEVERLSAAVLFADISGFTALAERLVQQQGAAGTEELSHLLNNYFGALIDLIATHGGEVVKFAGDGVLVCWPASSPEALPEATLRAASCGLAIQAHFSDSQPHEGVRLALRVGVGAGPVSGVHLGGVYGRWEFLLTGEPLIQVSVAEQRARPGEVLLSPAAWELIASQAEGEPRPVEGESSEAAPVCLRAVIGASAPATAPQASLLPEAEGALRAYLPGAILTRLAAGMTGWLAELRRVTVLFVNLPDLNHTTPVDQAQAVMSQAQTALYRYQGSINKLTVDDKGVILVAALGLPPLSHEDDAVRGVHAAMALQAALRELGVRSAVGVATGQAFCGTIGNQVRREYTMIGDVVNLAARLMQAAPGEILCDTATMQAAQMRLMFETLPPIQVKGKSEPVPVYRPSGQSRRAVPVAATMVGRSDERMHLAAELQNLLRGGPGGVVVIEGEAGIGKSRLVDDVRQQAGALGVRVLYGAGDAIEETTLFYAWRTVFGQLLDIELLEEPAARRERVLAALALSPEMLALAPLINAVLPLVELPENEITAPMVGQQRAEQTRALLLHLLQGVASDAPTALILEDAHWLDTASWALALAAMEPQTAVSPLLLIVVTRPLGESPPVEAQRLIESPGVQRLRLQALGSDETVSLLCQRLGVSKLPETLVHLIAEKAQGNPFFSEELAYALREAGLIRVRDGECEIVSESDLRAFAVPDTVQGVVTSRIDRLNPSQQMAIKAASVIGRVFAYRVLHDIYPVDVDRDVLPGHLDTLNRLDITPLESPEPNLAYIFKHVITQEVAYNLMLFAQRQRLHRAVAEWYERTNDDLSPLLSVLAYHWAQGQEAARAAIYYARAGDAAARLYVHAEARLHYTRALEALATLDESDERRRQQVDTLVKLVSVAWAADHPDTNMVRLSEAEQHCKQLLDPETHGPDADTSADRLRLARVHYWIGRLHYYRGALREAIGYFQQVLAVAREFGDEELLALPAAVIGRVLLLQGNFGRARMLLSQALPLLERLGNWPDWVFTLGFHGATLAAQGRYEEGLSEATRALTRAQEINNRVSIAGCHIILGFVHLVGGNASHMLAAGQDTVQVAETAGDLVLAYVGHAYNAWGSSRLGQHALAAERMARTYEVAEKLGGRLMIADWVAAANAELALRAGDFESAIARAEQAVTIAKTVSGLFGEGLARRVWGQALALHNPEAWAEAQEQLAESVRLLESGDCLIEAARTHLVWGQLCLSFREPGLARDHFAQAATHLEVGRLEPELSETRAALARLSTAS